MQMQKQDKDKKDYLSEDEEKIIVLLKGRRLTNSVLNHKKVTKNELDDFFNEEVIDVENL